MCILALMWHQHPNYPMVLASNRDEFLLRPTAAAHFWPDQPEVLGGRDLQAGGSWMLAKTNGRWASLTNYRDGRETAQQAKSRGQLVVEAIHRPLADLPIWLQQQAANYAGFNLLWGDAKQAWYFSNRCTQPAQKLAAGVYLLSNATLDVDWPKTQRLRVAVQEWLAQANCHPSQLFATLADTTKAADVQLPETHVGLDKERGLSSIFIQAQDFDGKLYGTRTSTLVWQEVQGTWHWHEKNFNRQQQLSNENKFTWGD